jgi:hypothetical protein
MLSRTSLQWGAALLIAASLIGVWALRPGLDVASPKAVLLQAESNCDSAQRACRIFDTDLELELRLGPSVRTMESFEISLRRLRGSLGTDAQIMVQFQMRDMEMGLNRYRLVMDAEGIWRGQAMLPVCSAGRSDWIAQVEISTSGQRWRAELPFTAESR